MRPGVGWFVVAPAGTAASVALATQLLRPRPALVIASGSGPNCHAYWPLSEPVAPATAEVANLRLAHALAADLGCFDASRTCDHPRRGTSSTILRGPWASFGPKRDDNSV